MFDWINSIYPENSVEAAHEGTVYLIKERDSNEEIERWLQKHYDNIFQNELNTWHTEKKTGRKKRTHKQFTEWFDFEIHSMILDLEKTAITKD